MEAETLCDDSPSCTRAGWPRRQARCAQGRGRPRRDAGRRVRPFQRRGDRLERPRERRIPRQSRRRAAQGLSDVELPLCGGRRGRSRTAQAAAGPDRAVQPRRPARALAGHVRPGVQPGARHPDRNTGLPGLHGPGILAQSVLFSAIFYGIAVIWERDLGIVHCLVTPAPRSIFGAGNHRRRHAGPAANRCRLPDRGADAVHIRWQLPAMLLVACCVFLARASSRPSRC